MYSIIICTSLITVLYVLVISGSQTGGRNPQVSRLPFFRGARDFINYITLKNNN